MKAKALGTIIIFLGTIALFFAITFPLVLDPFSTGIGSGIDPYQYVWNADVFADNIRSLKNPFYTTRFLMPEGTSLWMHTYTPIIGMLNIAINNPFLSVSLALILSFGFSTLGAYKLARHFEVNHISALSIGLIYAFSPYKTSHLVEHHHLLLTGHVPYFVLFFIRTFSHQNGKLHFNGFNNLAVCGILLIVSFLSDYYTTAFLFIFSAFYLCYPYSLKIIQSVSLKAKLVGLFLLVPLIHLLVKHLRSIGVDDKGGFYNSADLAGLLIPPQQSLLYSFDFLDDWRILAGFKGPNEQVVFVGLILFSVTIIFLFFRKKVEPEFRWIAAMAFIFALLSFPKLKIMEIPLGYGPFSWIHQLPFLNHIRNPGRYFSMVYLFLPLALAIKGEVISNKYSLKIKIVGVLLLICIMAEFLPANSPLFSKKDVPDSVQKLATNAQMKRIIMIPDGVKDGFNGAGRFRDEYLLWSVVHRKEIPGGYISRLNKSAFERFEQNPVLKFLGSTNFSHAPTKSEWITFLAEYKPEGLVIHSSLFARKDLMAYLEESLKPWISQKTNDEKAAVWILHRSN